MRQGNYICKCGKEFTETNRFNGHKSKCKIHLGDKYNEVVGITTKKANVGASTYFENQRIKKLETWILEKHKCETCKKIMNSKYGSGRFCNTSCKNKYTSRKNTEESNIKRRKAISKKIASGEWKPYNINPYNTYVETYWTFILKDKYNLDIEQQYRLTYKDKYGIDKYYYFDLLVNGKIDLEIDGPWHNRHRDRIRDNISREAGFIVYRVEYKDPKQEKEAVLNQIKEFIDFVNNIDKVKS